MTDQPLIIIACPGCGVKNRVGRHSADRVPVCAKCREPLVNEKENAAQAIYGKKLDEFMNLPPIGLRPEDGE